jgi:pyruvate,water dikinase
MNRLNQFFQKLFSKKEAQPPAEIDALRIDFKSRYHAFKLLLAANNKSLEIMADIERMLRGNTPFGMTFVRASSTALSVNVFNMIKHLDQLSQGKYRELVARFDDIQHQIETTITRRKMHQKQDLVIPFDHVNKEMVDVVGNKMANLGEMKNRLNMKTPEGFVITSAAYELFLSANELQVEIDRRFQSAEIDNIPKLYELSSEVQQLILRAEVPEALRSAIHHALDRLEAKATTRATFALRSSALGEDTSETSFAGQYRSILNVGSNSILEAYKEVVASKYAIQAITYRLNRGFRDEDVAMCVGCMEMVDAQSGGVMYTCNPVDKRDDAIFINAAWGLPKTVVDGSDACDLFVVPRTKPMKVAHAEIKTKARKFICFPEEGVCRLELTGDVQAEPSITEAQALNLAQTAITIEMHYAAAQDIEWAVSSSGDITLLQCRPLKQLEGTRPNRPGAAPQNGHPTIFRGSGITASPGTAFGAVFPVHKSMDILSFPEGAVLVTRQALPLWASLLSRAAAVVTEQGGFAGHLANVAREFGVPAIFSVPGAVDTLKAGNVITVDADNLSIYQGKVESLLLRSPVRENLMMGSPIFATLQQISRHIVPLNLLDPNSPEFQPRNCRTMHDLTRFIHEKSVSEMFNFGKTHDFSERSSKQLYHNVPMQWWILNLDDGFKEEVKGKYVKLENICSIPMRALWEGYAAVAWEGPPPIDGKGLLSVMFGSTMNPALTSGVRSRFADRNYFMISKNYCSLTSRLGYHFSTIEALISERASENYISFQFKGGAADNDRRIKRVYFIRDLLVGYGFRVDVREDNLIARVEGYDIAFMENRLKILGYLTLHTRQLDMIMSNPSSVQYYQSKIMRDIEKICNVECTGPNSVNSGSPL